MSQIGTIIALIATGWGALVLFYLGPGTARVRTTEAWSYVAISLLALGALFVPGAREPAAIVFVAAFALVLLIWGKERPSNDHELVYVVADERDAIRGRTNYRNSPPEQIYLFRLMARSRTAAESSSTICATSTSCGSIPASTTRSRPTAPP